MDKFINKNGYELGCRLVKGPRRAVRCQAAGDKLTTGTNHLKTKAPPGAFGNGGTPRGPRMDGKSTLNILQLNISGISNKKTELANILNQHNIQVALLQETQKH